MIDLLDTYRAVAHAWPHNRLANHDRAARRRGIRDLPAGQSTPDRPIVLLATAIPRLTSLTVAAHLLHVLPPTEPTSQVADELLETVDETSAGSLYRAHLALAVAVNDHGDDPDQWQPLIYDETASLLKAVSPDASPAPLIDHAEHAGRLAAAAIAALDSDPATATETIVDCLARLLAVCVLVDVATRRSPPGDEA